MKTTMSRQAKPSLIKRSRKNPELGHKERRERNMFAPQITQMNADKTRTRQVKALGTAVFNQWVPEPARENPKGIPSQSPGLPACHSQAFSGAGRRAASYPGNSRPRAYQPQRGWDLIPICAHLRHLRSTSFSAFSLLSLCSLRLNPVLEKV